MNELTLKEAQRLFRLDEETGKLYWRVSVGQRARPGVEAGVSNGKDGYLRIQVHGKKYLSHRLVWLLTRGYLPTQQVDHRDGCPTNNRPGNLRLVTQSQNMCNGRIPAHNSSGVKGVSWNKDCGKWVGYVAKDKRQLYLGLFTTLEEAEKAVHTARQRLHGEFARNA